MLYVKTEIKNSDVNGKGLFLLENVKIGQIIALFAENSKYITEEEYQEEQRNNNEIIIMSGVRYVGKYFLYTEEIGNEEYINHSSNPTVLYHCGICFAKRDLKIGDELTVDYKYFLATNDVNKFTDKTTNSIVDGIPPHEALLQSTRELLEMLEKIECDKQ